EQLALPERGGEALLGLAHLADGDLDRLLEEVLRGPVDQRTVAALTVIQGRPVERWGPAVSGLLGRLNPNRPMIQAQLWVTCLGYLLAGGHRPAPPPAVLLSAGGTVAAEAALLALEHTPAAALPLFRRALRAELGHMRLGAAATLALLDRPWGRREL